MPRIIFLMEEAHYSFSPQKLKRVDLGEPTTLSAHRTIRHAGVSLWLLDQVVSELPAACVANEAVVVAFRQGSPTCVATLARRLGLETEEQYEMLMKLSHGEAIVHYPGCPDALLVKLPQLEHEPLPAREEVEERVQESLRRLGYVERRKDSATAPDAEQQDGVTHMERTVMLDILQHVDTIHGRADRLGIDKGTEASAREGLERKGLIRLEGTVGNRRAIHGPTDKGYAWGESRTTVHKSHAGRCHDYGLQETLRNLGKRFPRATVRLNGEFAGVRADAHLTDSSGWLVAVQVCFSAHHAKEAANILKLSRCDLVDRVLVVASNKTMLNGIERAVKKEYAGELPAKAVFASFEETLDPGYDWVALAELLSSRADG